MKYNFLLFLLVLLFQKLMYMLFLLEHYHNMLEYQLLVYIVLEENHQILRFLDIHFLLLVNYRLFHYFHKNNIFLHQSNDILLLYQIRLLKLLKYLWLLLHHFQVLILLCLLVSQFYLPKFLHWLQLLLEMKLG